jgi:hypothetical protein
MLEIFKSSLRVLFTGLHEAEGSMWVTRTNYSFSTEDQGIKTAAARLLVSWLLVSWRLVSYWYHDYWYQDYWYHTGIINTGIMTTGIKLVSWRLVSYWYYDYWYYTGIILVSWWWYYTGIMTAGIMTAGIILVSYWHHATFALHCHFDICHYFLFNILNHRYVHIHV